MFPAPARRRDEKAVAVMQTVYAAACLEVTSAFVIGSLLVVRDGYLAPGTANGPSRYVLCVSVKGSGKQ